MARFVLSAPSMLHGTKKFVVGNAHTLATLGALAALSVSCGDNLVPFSNLVDAANNGGDGGLRDGNGEDPDAGDAGDASTGAAPTVVASGPANAATNVSVARKVTATFSRPMDANTLTTMTFTLRQGATPIAGTVTYSGTTATFTPTNPLGLSLMYTATITTGAADPQGAALAADHVWSFTTGACSHAPVNLRSASGFAVLAGSTVTNTGATVIVGDLGVSPGTAVVGFPPGQVNGTIRAGTPAAATAKQDLTTAYNEAAARTLCAVTVAGNLGGMTLTPGLYKSTSSLSITSGDLTLDAQGEPDAVFIFQTASTLTTTTGRKLILAGGAKASNIYWQVGTSATLGTSTSFHGTIMADQAITLGTDASLNGRVLARIAAVSLAANPITKPAP